MVAIKYAPIAAACLSLCTGVGASVLVKRQTVPDVGVTPAVNGALPAPASPLGARALENRASADVPANPPSTTFGVSGNTPGSTNENRALVALTPGGTVALEGLTGLSITQLASVADLATALAAILTGFAAPTLPVPIPALPAPVSGVTGTLSSTIATAVATLQGLLGSLSAILGPAVPPSVTSTLSPLLGVLGPLVPAGAGGTGVSPTDPTSVIGVITALLPVLANLAGVLGSVGA